MIPIEAFDEPYSLIIEPWAVGFEINPGDRCRLLVTNPAQSPEVSCGVHKGMLILTVWNPGSTFSFFRGDKTDLEMPIPSL